MLASTALVTANEANSLVAEQAVRQALERAGRNQANGVLLFLSPEFSRHAQSSVIAAARAAQCTQIFGAIVAGCCTEAGWAIDRPAAAAMALYDEVSLAPAETGTEGDPLLCCTASPFPAHWEKPRRVGINFHGSAGNTAVWQNSRVLDGGSVEARIAGARTEIFISHGLKPIGEALTIDSSRGYDLLTAGGCRAQDGLRRILPTELRDGAYLPQHMIVALFEEGGNFVHAAALLSVNGDGSLTLTAQPRPGTRLHWALRQPLSAEVEMRNGLAALSHDHPDFALFFSCIGRGPYFYGDEDRDLVALKERYPDMPILGVYGTGQIGFRDNRTCQMQNSVITVLHTRKTNVQP